ncbi:3-deoxy-8-phosphooctulonate synthase [bacterium]|nr:MAG: 3-deoxy-8-phosphooctulonate synthase [bacterium]RKZ18545.1 MAG: 3-deoxy-8-phosphooctulonate synthase [bacterium]
MSDFRVGQGEELLLIAGPCVLEDRDEMFAVAEQMSRLARELGVNYVFKASFLKDNRTRSSSPRGPGAETGLRMLQDIASEFSCPVLTDVHVEEEIRAAADAGIDIVQIPAFLSRQSRLLEAAARSGCVVNVKKGQFLAPEDLEHVAGKIEAAGGERILFTERGTTFGYHDLVVDFRGFAVARDLGWPWIFDVTHSLQRPSGQGAVSGGTPDLAPMMARAGCAAGVDGLFLEVHPEPARAHSDASTQLPLESVRDWLPLAVDLHRRTREARAGERA